MVSWSDSRDEYKHAKANSSAAYLHSAITRILSAHRRHVREIIDIGCGTGDVSARLMAEGYDILGVDASADALRQAALKYPGLRTKPFSIYDDPRSCEGPWDAAVATEVIEHLYFPRRLLSVASSLVRPGGLVIVTTPYHGYLKYLLLALSGRMDDHLQALRDNGHIKFFSESTVRQLFAEAGLTRIRIDKVGRIGPIAKSMIVYGEVPGPPRTEAE